MLYTVFPYKTNNGSHAFVHGHPIEAVNPKEAVKQFIKLGAGAQYYRPAGDEPETLTKEVYTVVTDSEGKLFQHIETGVVYTTTVFVQRTDVADHCEKPVLDSTVVSREQLFGLWGDFSWDFGMWFFIETALGNFEWADPDYGGDNSMHPFVGSFQEWVSQHGDLARDKGHHDIARYTGGSFVLKPARERRTL